MLSKEQIEKQKNLLLGEKKRLEEKMARLSEFPDYGRNDDDNAKELSDFENNLSLEGQIKLLLQKTNRALKAIESNTYGKCRKCKSAIESGRLEIMPYAELCITCQREDKK